MRRLRAWLLRLASLVGAGRTDTEIREELREHRDLLAEHYAQVGMSAEAARQRAASECGSLSSAADAYSDRRGLPLLESGVRDVRMACRSLSRTPLLMVSIVAVLALGIGLSTMVVAMFHAITWVGLPVTNADAVLRLDQTFAGEYDRRVQGEASRFSYPELEIYRSSTQALDAVAGAYQATMTWRVSSEAVPVHAARVTGDYFRVLPVTPSAGRLLTASDARRPVVVISHRLWTRSFASASDAVGRAISLDRATYTIVGVAPPSFSGTEIESTDVWLPLEASYMMSGKAAVLAESNVSWLQVFGRLRPGVSVTSATADAALVAARFDSAYIGRRTTIGLTHASRLPSTLRRQALAAGGVVAFLLALLFVICGSNAASLLLARGAARQREIALRVAIGAGRTHIVRQLLAEVGVIALASGALGLLVCFAAVRLLSTSTTAQDLVQNIHADGGVFAFAFATAVAVALVCGLAPVRQALQVNCLASLKGEGSLLGARMPALRLRRVLIATQVTLSIVLLVVASLLARSASHAWRTHPGYATTGLYVVEPDAAWQPGVDAADGSRLGTELKEELARVPRVRAVSQAALAPFSGAGISQATANLSTPASPVHFNAIDGRFFETLGAPLVAGRSFAPREDGVVIVNAAMAKRFWTDERSALGKTLFIADRKVEGHLRPMEVVGVAPTLQTMHIGAPDQPTFYMPLTDTDPGMAVLIVRAEDDVPLQHLVASVVRARDADGFARVTSLAAHLASQTAPARVGVAVIGVIGLLALIVAAVGIHGLIAYTVANRTRDIGVYRALGARPRDVLQLILSWTLRGVAAGAISALLLMMFAAAAFGARLRTTLYGLHPLDPVSFALGTALLVVVIGLAIYLPARRALGMAPLDALRSDG